MNADRPHSDVTSATAFVLSEPTSVIAECIKSCGYPVVDVLKPLRSRLARVRLDHLSRTLPLQQLWLDRRLVLPPNVETVVIFDRPEMFGIARALRHHHPDLRIILWFWNPVTATMRLPTDLASFEVRSFDPVDAKRHGWGWNSTFFFRELRRFSSPEKEFDLIFVGRDKGRASTIRAIDALLTAEGKQTFVTVLAQPSDYLPYLKVLARTGRSRAVLDIVQDGQRGLTLRAMEALFLGVKLVTNNPAVRDEPNYPQENVWVLDDDGDGLALATFLESNPVGIPDESIAFYDFHGWLERLLVR